MFLGSLPSLLNVKINGRLYPIEELIGKSIYARIDTKLYRGSGMFSGKYETPMTVKKGGFIGNMNSWVETPDGKVFFSFRITNPFSGLLKEYPSAIYYVLSTDIDERTVVEQGARTTEQVAEDEKEEEKTTGDKILSTITKLGFGIAAIYALTNLGKTAIQSRNKQ